jgi:hypothetical protein
VRFGRKKQRAASDRPEVAEHLHDDDEMTLERLATFGEAPASVQLLVLGQLRTRSEDQEAALLPAIEAMGLAILALFLTLIPDSMRFAVLPEPITDPLGRWLGVVLGMVILALVAVALVLPTIRTILRADRDRGRAAAWHEAYDRELTRRRALPGRAGRVWRKSHAI